MTVSNQLKQAGTCISCEDLSVNNRGKKSNTGEQGEIDFIWRVQQVAIALTVVLTPEPTLYDRRFQSYSRFRGIIFPRLAQSRQLMVNRSPKNDSGSISRLLVVRSARYRSLNGQNQKIKNQNFWSKKWKKMKFLSCPTSPSCPKNTVFGPQKKKHFFPKIFEKVCKSRQNCVY